MRHIAQPGQRLGEARWGLELTLANQELILWIGKDVVGLDHGGDVTSADGGIVGGLGRISRRRGQDTEACDQRKARHDDGLGELSA